MNGPAGAGTRGGSGGLAPPGDVDGEPAETAALVEVHGGRVVLFHVQQDLTQSACAQVRQTQVGERAAQAQPLGLGVDAEGFLMAWRGDPEVGGRLLGSHWTKVHPPGDAGDAAVGEIYVLGVDPDAQGLRLGRALTDLGLAHLRARGLHEVLLYVEEDNAAAVHLYESRGFRRFAVDVSWRRDRS